jgi:hypothetical protein
VSQTLEQSLFCAGSEFLVDRPWPRPYVGILPTIEMTSQDGGKVLRIGPQIVTYIRRAPYPGWTESFAMSSITYIRWQLLSR